MSKWWNCSFPLHMLFALMVVSLPPQAFRRHWWAKWARFVDLILTKNKWAHSLFIVSRLSSKTRLNIARITNCYGKANEKTIALAQCKMIEHPLFDSKQVPNIFCFQATIGLKFQSIKPTHNKTTCLLRYGCCDRD